MKRLILLSALATGSAEAAYFPMYSSWPQPAGPGSAIELSYSYANLLHGNILDARSGQPIAADLLRGAFEAALRDYTEILPITFREVADAGPAPESGEYDPTGLADIRIGQVAHIDGANAYAYFPHEGSGLAGDIVFNAERFGNDWSLALFYGVAQHELGHSLGMGHALDENAAGGDGQLSAYNGPLFALQDDMISALQAVYGTGQGNVIPLTPATVPLPAAIWLMPFGRQIEALNPAEKYGVRLEPPALQPWGMRGFLLTDPSGVLWRIGQNLYEIHRTCI